MTPQPKDLNRCGECGRERCGYMGFCTLLKHGGREGICHGHPKEEDKCLSLGIHLHPKDCSPPHQADQTEKVMEAKCVICKTERACISGKYCEPCHDKDCGCDSVPSWERDFDAKFKDSRNGTTLQFNLGRLKSFIRSALQAERKATLQAVRGKLVEQGNFLIKGDPAVDAGYSLAVKHGIESIDKLLEEGK